MAELRSGKFFNGGQDSTENIYVIDEMIGYPGLGSRFRYLVGAYCYSMVDDTAKPLRNISQQAIDAYSCQCEKCQKQKSLMEAA